jgi:hypothetical protein
VKPGFKVFGLDKLFHNEFDNLIIGFQEIHPFGKARQIKGFAN